MLLLKFFQEFAARFVPLVRIYHSLNMILITGCNGLVGQAVARLLLTQNHAIRAIKRPGSDLRLLRDIEDQIEWI
ncbi:MAG: hypothetical protein EAZ80_11030, partial [Runella slithyformis]